jgi:hypothetical protein
MDVPKSLGFIGEPVGTHSSRTIMFAELSSLLASTGPQVSYAELQDLAVNHNAVQKASATGRAKTFRHLREFYGLNIQLPVYSAMRHLWDPREDERPLLAMLCACARDPVLRESAEYILPIPSGAGVDKAGMESFLSERFPGRYGETVLPRTVRNMMSSWTQSGHLIGRFSKKRGKAVAGPASAAYALFLGYLCGLRGDALFGAVWTRILDRSESEAHALAAEASARGLITYKRAGGLVEVDMHLLLQGMER